MTKGLCNLLIPKTFDEALAFVEQSLGQLDLTIANPESGRITTCTNEGEQLQITSAQIVAGALSGAVNNVQFWKTESEDLFVSWRREAMGWKFIFYFDGLNADFVETLSVNFLKIVLGELSGAYKECIAYSIEYE